jgi:hypothetical protein
LFSIGRRETAYCGTAMIIKTQRKVALIADPTIPVIDASRKAAIVLVTLKVKFY